MINNISDYKGQKIVLNSRLIIQKGLSDDTVEKIFELHKELIDIDYKLVEEDERDSIKKLLYDWHIVNFKLQELWGFKRDKNCHKFWRLTACSCPRMDNDDRYPDGHYIHNLNCKVHGA